MESTRMKRKEKVIKRKRSNHNITPFLHPKLQRRIMYEGCESEVDVGRDWKASHVGDGNIVILEIL